MEYGNRAAASSVVSKQELGPEPGERRPGGCDARQYSRPGVVGSTEIHGVTASRTGPGAVVRVRFPRAALDGAGSYWLESPARN